MSTAAPTSPPSAELTARDVASELEASKQPALPDGHPQAEVPAGDRLLDGMVMDAAEFRRRWNAIEAATDREFRAELIFGTVSVTAPPDLDSHSVPDSLIATILGTYSARTPGVRSASNGAVVYRSHSLAAPDQMLFIEPECGGQVQRDRDGKRTGVPELVVEIANTSMSRDLTTKRIFYEEAGVREYLVYLVPRGRFMLFTRAAAADEPQDATRDLVERSTADPVFAGQVFRSVVFPGLVIDCGQVIAEDIAGALATLESGLSTPEHAEFLETLAVRRAGEDRDTTS